MNELDELITTRMLMLERRINKKQNQYPWSPTFDAAILEVSLWKLIIFEIKNKVSNEIQIQRVLRKLKASPIIDRNSITVAINLRKAKKAQMNIQLDAKNHNGKFLQQKIDEEKKRNMKHSRYLRMLFFTKNQIEINSTINIFKSKNNQSNITYIDIPKDTSINWNEIPKKLPKKSGKKLRTQR